MIYILDQITSVLTVFVVIAALALVVLFVYVFSIKKRRQVAKLVEETCDYTKFRREDTRDYIRLDDIRDDMIITDNGRRFIAVIRGVGFDFFYESPEVQLRTVRGMYSFVSTIAKPVTFRQHSKAVDLEYSIKRYQQVLEEREEELFHVQQDLKEMEFNLKKSGMDASKERIYRTEIEKARTKEEALEWRIYHIKSQMQALYSCSKNSLPEYEQDWVVEWVYNPLEFTYDLSDTEIYYRAIKELHSIVSAKIHALGNCQVHAWRCRTEDLIDMCRRYSSPVSAERYKLSDIQTSAYFDDVKRSDPFAEARNRALEEIRMESEQALLDAQMESTQAGSQAMVHESSGEATGVRQGAVLERKQSVEEDLEKRKMEYAPRERGKRKSESALRNPTGLKNNKKKIVRGNIIQTKKEQIANDDLFGDE